MMSENRGISDTERCRVEAALVKGQSSLEMTEQTDLLSRAGENREIAKIPLNCSRLRNETWPLP